MSAQVVAGGESRFWGIWRLSVNSLALALSSAVVGATLVAISWRFGSSGPIVLLGLALAPFLTLLIAVDLRVGALLLVLVLPLNSLFPQLGALPPPLNIPLQLLEVTLAFVATVVALVRLSRGYVPLRWSPVLWTALAIVAWALLGLNSAVDIDAGLKTVLSLISAVTLISVILAVIRSDHDLRTLTGAFVAVGAATAGYALATGGPAQSYFGGAVVEGRLEGLFDQPNQLGAFCALVLFLAIAFGLGGRTRTSRTLGWLAGGVLTAGLLLSLSRGAWIGAAMGGAYLLLVLPRARKLMASVLIPFAIVAMVLGPSLSSTPQVQIVSDRLTAFTAENPYDGRPAIYAEARRQIETRPLFGYGPGSFSTTSARSTTERATVAADHAHNIWLNWGAEMGIPAVLLIVILMASLGLAGRRTRRRARQRGDHQQDAFAAALVASLITVVGQGLVDYPWKNQGIFFGISTVVALLLAAHLLSDPDEESLQTTDAGGHT